MGPTGPVLRSVPAPKRFSPHMMHWKKSLSLLAVLALMAVQAARADVSMVNYIPGDVEIGIVVDVERLLAEPEIKNMAGMANEPLAAQGLPAVDILKSLALGVDIPADVMQGGQPAIFFAVLANGSMQSVMDKAVAEGGMAPQDVEGRPFFVSPNGDGAATLSNDKSMGLFSNSVDNVKRMMSVEAAGNLTSKPTYNLGAGLVSDPAIYVTLGGVDPMLMAQLSAMIGMGIMMNAQTPEAQQMATGVQQNLMAIGAMKSFEMAVGFGAEDVNIGMKFTMNTEADVPKMEALVKGVAQMGAASNPGAGDPLAGYAFQAEGAVLQMLQKTNKAEFFTGMQAGIGAAMANAGGGGM